MEGGVLRPSSPSANLCLQSEWHVYLEEEILYSQNTWIKIDPFAELWKGLAAKKNGSKCARHSQNALEMNVLGLGLFHFHSFQSFVSFWEMMGFIVCGINCEVK